ncbi:hypothetical protein GL50803_004239 [Giardia duodenalis]|uniref:Uncharacterized protein n=3 Tax=Giardia intestinalis TaxID=5741 RepID=A8BVK6_GIAIC|nr:hypothetical protein GL50803_004239 [Giardia intestinalis]EFO62749.1 Hypothetical protein GLP15_1441 [Giardia lamblia P15]ESU37387.1 Hypothetical protein DHA2_4239 [Giardia intestinalis]KAE8304510.1 hypothetical protein GL50803_004239 [Giardia intestinalis]|eukprot:XP_001704574.1 Hypothetical protein GL50803_4239 [Giardia lamblia ATCC 50803]
MPINFNNYGTYHVLHSELDPDSYVLRINANADNGYQKFSVDHTAEILVKLNQPTIRSFTVRIDEQDFSMDEVPYQAEEDHFQIWLSVPANTMVKLEWM